MRRGDHRRQLVVAKPNRQTIGALWILGGIVSTVVVLSALGRSDWVGVLGVLAAVVVGNGFFWLLFRMRAELEGETALVVNMSTVRVARSDVRSVEVGALGWGICPIIVTDRASIPVLGAQGTRRAGSAGRWATYEAARVIAQWAAVPEPTE